MSIEETHPLDKLCLFRNRLLFCQHLHFSLTGRLLAVETGNSSKRRLKSTRKSAACRRTWWVHWIQAVTRLSLPLWKFRPGRLWGWIIFVHFRRTGRSMHRSSCPCDASAGRVSSTQLWLFQIAYPYCEHQCVSSPTVTLFSWNTGKPEV